MLSFHGYGRFLEFQNAVFLKLLLMLRRKKMHFWGFCTGYWFIGVSTKSRDKYPNHDAHWSSINFNNPIAMKCISLKVWWSKYFFLSWIFSFLEETGDSILIRACALDSGTLTTDTEIVRMSHCGHFYYQNK